MGACRMPISSHNVERTIKSHLGRMHPEITGPTAVTVIRFNNIRPLQFTVPPPTKRAQTKKRQQGDEKEGKNSDEEMLTTQEVGQPDQVCEENQKRDEGGQTEDGADLDQGSCHDSQMAVATIDGLDEPMEQAEMEEGSIDLDLEGDNTSDLAPDEEKDDEKAGEEYAVQKMTQVESSTVQPKCATGQEEPPSNQGRDFHEGILGVSTQPARAGATTVRGRPNLSNAGDGNDDDMEPDEPGKHRTTNKTSNK